MSPKGVGGPTGVNLGDASDHSCVYTDEGRVICWGSNGWGQVNRATAGLPLEPVRVHGLDPR